MKSESQDRNTPSLTLNSLAGQGGELEATREGFSNAGAESHPILLYDGVCGLCNGLVQFILRRDRTAIFRFAALQSPIAARILERHGADAADLDTVYVVIDYDRPSESLLSRSDAIIFVLKKIRGFWHASAFVMKIVPRPVRDLGYRFVARIRYRIFGRYDTCPLPTENTRARFLDQ
jgi:predicted DCC family thiol-disulfide oxidoreductase YuxK